MKQFKVYVTGTIHTVVFYMSSTITLGGLDLLANNALYSASNITVVQNANGDSNTSRDSRTLHMSLLHCIICQWWKRMQVF